MRQELLQLAHCSDTFDIDDEEEMPGGERRRERLVALGDALSIYAVNLCAKQGKHRRGKLGGIFCKAQNAKQTLINFQASK